MGVNSLPKTVTRQRRGCDSNPGPSAPESSTRLPSHLKNSDSLKIISHALILSKVEYELPATAGLLSETDKSRLDASSRNTKRGLCHSNFFISQLIDRADCKLFKLIQLSHHCLYTLLPSPRLPYSTYSLRPRGRQFSLPQLNTILYRNVFINRCFFQYV